jgi:hypothetical protein
MAATVAGHGENSTPARQHRAVLDHSRDAVTAFGRVHWLRQTRRAFEARRLYGNARLKPTK